MIETLADDLCSDDKNIVFISYICYNVILLHLSYSIHVQSYIKG